MCGRQGLDRRDVAARDLTPVIDDQDVVAERLRLVAGSASSGRSFGRGAPRPANSSITDRLRIGSIPVENSSRNMTGRIHEQRLGDLDPPAKPAAQIHRLARRILHQAELLHHIVGPARATTSPCRPWNRPNVSRLSRTLRKISAALSCTTTTIFRRTASGSRTTSTPATSAVPDVGPDQGRQDLERRGLPRAVRSEQPEDVTGGDGEGQAVDGCDRRRAAFVKGFSEVLNPQGVRGRRRPTCRHRQRAR